MSEVSEVPATPAAPAETPAQETDWKAEARKWEARAKENLTKVNELSPAAAKLAEIEEARKTAEQKATERLQAAESRAAELERKADRAEVAASKGVPLDLISGTSREEMEASADKLIAFRGAQPSTPKPDLSQGPQGDAPKQSTADQFASQLADF